MSPMKPCKSPMCPSLTRTGYCDKHQKDYNKSKRNTNEWSSWYSTTRWRKARLLFLRGHPICECAECERLNHIATANVIDHIIPFRGDYNLFWDQRNWMAMSKRCHDIKTAREDGGFGNKLKRIDLAKPLNNA